jgi:hypothetical protein
MNLWIVTIGNSDVQLVSKKVCKEKGLKESQYSNNVWGYWCTDEIKENYQLPYPCDPKRVFDDVDEPYKIGARILGTVYKANPKDVQQEVWSYLKFPLLDNFVDVFRKRPEQYPAPEAIAVLLTDQSAIFDDRQRSTLKSPYWQDTCELELILQTYFAEKFLGAPCKFIPLIPKSEAESLDNWNAVLDLVRGEFRNLTIADQPIQVNSGENVYVSHQAGTPAISSAVQFCSLAKFGDRVRFLVSSEQNTKPPEILLSSSYLKGIRKQEAKKLLERHDYSGVKDLLDSYLKDEKHQETKILLEAAIQWNFAKFDEFANELQKLADQDLAQVVKERSQHYWWTAYEAAYLGTVRLLKQGNTVEAMFHTFRSVEGLLRRWIDKFYAEEIKQTKHPKWEENERWNRNLNSYGEDLYWFLTLKKSVDLTKDIKQNTTPDIFVFGSQIFKKRNDLFHQLKGLQGKEEVFENWRSPNEPKWKQNSEGKWKMRVLKCLNFIAKEDLPKEFESLEEASLMAKVHQELERAIASL